MKKTTIILLIVAVLAVLGTVFILLPKEEVEEKVVKEREEDKEVDIIKKEEINTSDWLIYENKEYGFKLKHPSDWTDENGLSDQVEYSEDDITYRNLFYRIKKGKSQKRNTELYDGAYVKVSVVDGNYDNLDFFVNKTLEYTKLNKTFFSGIPAFSVEKKITYGDEFIEDSFVKESYFYYNGKIYRTIFYTVGDDYDIFKGFILKIEKSFNFKNQGV